MWESLYRPEKKVNAADFGRVVHLFMDVLLAQVKSLKTRRTSLEKHAQAWILKVTAHLRSLQSFELRSRLQCAQNKQRRGLMLAASLLRIRVAGGSALQSWMVFAGCVSMPARKGLLQLHWLAPTSKKA